MYFFNPLQKTTLLTISWVISTILLLNLVVLAAPKEQKKPNQTTITKKQKTKPKKALIELQHQIEALLKQPEFKTAGVCVRIITQASGKVIFEQDTEKLVKPASNMKVYTTAVALELLGSEYRIRTSVYAQEKPDNQGNINGNLILYGRGDPTLASSYVDDTKPFDLLAKQLVDAGIKKIAGDLIADESYFRGSPLGQGWEWLDLQWQFGAEITALTAYDNKFDIQIKPGEKLGEPAQISITPDIGQVSIINKLDTIEAKAPREIGLNRGLADNSLLAWGKLPLDDAGFSAKIAFHHPAELAANLFQQALKRAGIIVSGKIIFVDASLRSPMPASEPEKLVELAAVESPPLSEIIRVINKFSQNLYAELLLRTMGRVKGKAGKDSDEAGVEVIKDFLRQVKIDPTSLAIYDGSGLSRKDLTNVLSTTELLRYISNSPNFETFRKSLPISGVDGTLRRRMSDITIQQKVQAKTGTLSNTSSLSGYITSTLGETFIFSIMVDNFTQEIREALNLQDKLCEHLVNFTGKVDPSTESK